MKDNEIVKALEELTAYSSFNAKIKKLLYKVIDLIFRLKKESNKYRHKVQAQKGELTRLYKEIKCKKAELDITRLENKALTLEKQFYALSMGSEAEKKEEALAEAEHWKQIAVNLLRK